MDEIKVAGWDKKATARERYLIQDSESELDQLQELLKQCMEEIEQCEKRIDEISKKSLEDIHIEQNSIKMLKMKYEIFTRRIEYIKLLIVCQKLLVFGRN